MDVARGRRIDQAEQAFRTLRVRRRVFVPVLGTDIDGRLLRQALPAEEVIELRLVVVREEDAMAQKGEARGLRVNRPGESR